MSFSTRLRKPYGRRLGAFWRKGPHLALFGILAVGLSACIAAEEPQQYPMAKKGGWKPQYGDPESVFGAGGLTLLGGEDQAPAEAGMPGVAVNSFLWRASLDSLAFMPLATADAFGGVIITDWYTPPASPEERFKVNVRILSRDLRADGLSVSIFRQERRDGVNWTDVPVSDSTVTELEDAILTRARELRIAQIGQ